MQLNEVMPSIGQLVKYGYNDIRSDESEALLARITERAIPQERPILVQVSGIPGAGKSAFCKEFLKSHTAFSFVSFDAIMDKLEGYNTSKKQQGLENAFCQYEMPARVIGYELLRRLLEMKANVILEHSGVNPAHIELFKSVKNMGYKTASAFIICDEDTAIRRSKNRSKRGERYTPPQLIHERFEKIEQYIPMYKQLAGYTQVLRLKVARSQDGQPAKLLWDPDPAHTH